MSKECKFQGVTGRVVRTGAPPAQERRPQRVIGQPMPPRGEAPYPAPPWPGGAWPAPPWLRAELPARLARCGPPRRGSPLSSRPLHPRAPAVLSVSHLLRASAAPLGSRLPSPLLNAAQRIRAAAARPLLGPVPPHRCSASRLRRRAASLAGSLPTGPTLSLCSLARTAKWVDPVRSIWRNGVDQHL